MSAGGNLVVIRCRRPRGRLNPDSEVCPSAVRRRYSSVGHHFMGPWDPFRRKRAHELSATLSLSNPRRPACRILSTNSRRALSQVLRRRRLPHEPGHVALRTLTAPLGACAPAPDSGGWGALSNLEGDAGRPTDCRRFSRYRPPPLPKSGVPYHKCSRRCLITLRLLPNRPQPHGFEAQLQTLLKSGS